MKNGKSSKKVIVATGISLSILSGIFFSNQIMTEVSAATTNVEASSTLPADSDVNYTINYVDSQDTSKILASKTGVAKGGTSIMPPKVLVAGYSASVYTLNIKPVTSEALKKQTLTVNLNPMYDVNVDVETKEPGSEISFTNPTIKVKNNDTTYRSSIDSHLTASQLDREIDPKNTYIQFEMKTPGEPYQYVYVVDIPALEGKTDITMSEFLDAAFSYRGLTDYLPDEVSNMRVYCYYAKPADNDNNNNTDEVVRKNQKVATINSAVDLFKKDGTSVTNRQLAAHTAWFSDQELTRNGVTYYRVSTTEWVKASDVYVYDESGISSVRVHADGTLVDYTGKTITNRKLQAGTDWRTDRVVLINGKKYYRVSTNEFLSADDADIM